MAGRLTIRRVGHILPTVCLVVLLMLIGIMTWLSTAGLPDCVLRKLETEATAATGLPVRIAKIKLAPRAGLAIKAEDISLEIQQPEAPPASLTIEKAQISFSISHLLAGRLQPVNLHVLRVQADLPLSHTPGDCIVISPLNLYASWPQKNKGIAAEADAMVQGIHLTGKLALGDPLKVLNSLGSENRSESTELSPGEQLAGLRPWLREFRQQVERQQWEQVPPPHIRISAAHREEWVLDLDAQVPSYTQGLFHFLDSQLKARYAKNELTISNLSFRTENPGTRVRLQAGYNLNSRELEFSTRSTAPVVRLLDNYLGEKAPALLDKLRAQNNATPDIELNGSAVFSEDFALHSITLRGKIEQKGFRVGNVQADHLLISFFMRDGSFNLDHCLVKLPQGHFDAAAQLTDGTGRAELEFSLPDEIILDLAREITGDEQLALPEGIGFSGNLEAHLSCEMSTPMFEAGKTRLEELVPTLHCGQLQFRSRDISLHNTTIQAPVLNLRLDGIEYGNEIRVAQAHLQAQVAAINESETDTALGDSLLDLQIQQLATTNDRTHLQLGHTAMKLQASAAQQAESAVKGLLAEASVDGLQMNLDEMPDSLTSAALKADISLDTLTHADTTAEELQLQLNIPAGLVLSDAWHNMQRDTCVQLGIRRISSGAQFYASDTDLTLRNTAPYTMQLQLESKLEDDRAALSATATLTNDDLLQLTGIDLHLPAARLLPLFGGEPLQELRLPRLVNLQGDALIDPAAGRLLNCHYRLQLPELIRVCNEVHVHKGMEIPLELAVSGSFSTAPDGSMNYEADVRATHAEGKLEAHVAGDPLRECRITGHNTIPVSIINALIDNADAHWIMRDFRCTPGLTRNVISDIDTTIRYDEGIYVFSSCRAALYNMDFQLGAIRDKEDARGNPTGEEYLRTDLGRNPFTRVKEGHCGVEVIVQLDCKDSQGKPLPDDIRINLLNPDLLYDNRPWLSKQKIKGGASTSRLAGEAVRFDIEKRIITLHKLKGTCYPAYSIGMYYAPLHHFLEDIVLTRPADIETDYCLFPISSRCEIPMQGLIRADAADGAGFRFLGTTIPLRNFSGFINISDSDVYLDRLNAQSWGGVLNGSLRIGFAGRHTTLDGYFIARNLNLKDIVASYGVEFTPATCNGFIRFQAPRPDLEAVQAYGQVHLQDGDLMEIGLFRPIGALISDMPKHLEELQNSLPGGEKVKLPDWSGDFVDAVWSTGGKAIDSVGRSALQLPFANHFLRYGIDEASAKFDITKGHLITRDMRATGYNLDVGVQLDINLETLTFRGDLWPKISSVPTVLISPVTLLSDFLIDINLYGDLLAPEWEFGLSKKLQGEPASLSPEPQTNKK